VALESQRISRCEYRSRLSRPPFNSSADYNVLFREPSGAVSQAQFHAFTDTWSWADAAELAPRRRYGLTVGSNPTPSVGPLEGHPAKELFCLDKIGIWRRPYHVIIWMPSMG
jgi:hypothetical protein